MQKTLNFKAKYSTLLIMNSLIALVFSGQLFAASAQDVRLMPDVQAVSAEGHAGQLILAGTLESLGAESVEKVYLEDPGSGKILLNLETISAGEKKDFSITLDEKELGIVDDGAHTIPLRFSYTGKDKSQRSSALVVRYLKNTDGQKSAQVVIGVEEDVQRTGVLDIPGSTQLRVILQNQSSAPAKVSLNILVPRELAAILPQKEFSLDPQESRLVNVKIENASAAKGASFASYAIISGTSEGLIFSDYVTFVANVTGAKTSSWAVVLFFIVAGVFTALGVHFYKRDKGPKIAEVGDTIAARPGADEQAESSPEPETK